MEFPTSFTCREALDLVLHFRKSIYQSDHPVTGEGRSEHILLGLLIASMSGSAAVQELYKDIDHNGTRLTELCQPPHLNQFEKILADSYGNPDYRLTLVAQDDEVEVQEDGSSFDLLSPEHVQTPGIPIEFDNMAETSPNPQDDQELEDELSIERDSSASELPRDRSELPTDDTGYTHVPYPPRGLIRPKKPRPASKKRARECVSGVGRCGRGNRPEPQGPNNGMTGLTVDEIREIAERGHIDELRDHPEVFINKGGKFRFEIHPAYAWTILEVVDGQWPLSKDRMEKMFPEFLMIWLRNDQYEPNFDSESSPESDIEANEINEKLDIVMEWLKSSPVDRLMTEIRMRDDQRWAELQTREQSYMAYLHDMMDNQRERRRGPASSPELTLPADMQEGESIVIQSIEDIPPTQTRLSSPELTLPADL